MNSTTAPTFLQLHEDADRIAKVAYQDDPKALDRRAEWQKVQKRVMIAGQNGVDNADLPKSPQEFFSAGPEDRTRFSRNLASRADGTVASGVSAALQAAQKRSTQGEAKVDPARTGGKSGFQTPHLQSNSTSTTGKGPRSGPA